MVRDGNLFGQTVEDDDSSKPCQESDNFGSLAESLFSCIHCLEGYVHFSPPKGDFPHTLHIGETLIGQCCSGC